MRVRSFSVGENARSDEEERRPRKGWHRDPASCAHLSPSAEQRQKRPFRLAIRRLVRTIVKPDWLVFGEQDWTDLGERRSAIDADREHPAVGAWTRTPVDVDTHFLMPGT